MLIVGFGYMELAWDRTREPIRAMGLPTGKARVREFGIGRCAGVGNGDGRAADRRVGGHFYVQLWTAPRAWGLLVVQLLTLLAGALAGEIAFRGYPFQKLIETVGPFAATILAAVIFGALRVTTARLNADSGLDQRCGGNLVIRRLLENSCTVVGLGIALCMDRKHRHPVRPTAGQQPSGFEHHSNLRRRTYLADRMPSLGRKAA